MTEGPYRPEGRYITAKDISDRLLPDLDINEVMLWSPDLFAYTSYLLAKTSAYQLVVSPPSRQKWQPQKKDIIKWLCPPETEPDNAETNIKDWYECVKQKWGNGKGSENFNNKYKEIRVWQDEDWKNLWNEKIEKENPLTGTGVKDFHEVSGWEALVRIVGLDWKKKLEATTQVEFNLIDDNTPPYPDRQDNFDITKHKKDREEKLLKILLRNTPAMLLACWTFFHKQITKRDFHNGHPLQIIDLLCNQDDVQGNKDYCDKLWNVSQALLTMHAIADIASEGFGLKTEATANPALKFAETLLITGRQKYHSSIYDSGSLSTFNIERCRVLPKRHNPGIGITLRSLSSNLAFHQSAVDVVWRKTRNNTLGNKFCREDDVNTKKETGKKKFSLLLLPFPLNIRANDFREDGSAQTDVVRMSEKYGFFSYEPFPDKTSDESRKETDKEKLHENQTEEIDKAIKLIAEANKELSDNIDIILFPETSLSLKQYESLKIRLEGDFKLGINRENIPSIIIAGVRESRTALARTMNERTKIYHSEETKNTEETENKYKESDFNFPRNAVYCQYFDTTTGTYYNNPDEHSSTTPKYKQYKHHRWRLEHSQIRRYGLSSVFEPKEKIWWESIKIPKRRVSFLNVGDRITISHLICEDLARQDPIAELVRHVGPSLVVAILMDGPQLKNRWSSRYATVLSDDPGCSVITLTSLGMVKRHQTEFGKMSRVIALWNDSTVGDSREIELAQGAEAVLLTLTIDEMLEKTADGREEMTATSVIHLNDVIQIYPSMDK